ncbi:ABC transporter permease [uncultured Hoeflea sp.]|uniref:ABC transporter permease n=1 Tax=uncultured Hoeflea sp. TaxID=538666 RepID=UPI0026246649|nr:ABC transporter permease [uncultured Hoeflea sp.]
MRIINRRPSRFSGFFLAAIPFIAVVVVYMIASRQRLAENPADKLLPSFQSMGSAFWRMAFEPDRRSGDYLLWLDTLDSLWRLGIGMAIATALALVIGLLIGFIPHVRSALAPFVATFSLIPPITILPILFIVFGLGEAAKVALIVAGTAPVMIRSTAQAVMTIPREMIIKAETLGASVWQMLTRLVLPQTLPGLINSIRLALVPAWIFLISAEAIASTTGLGYRIFLVRRYLAMDVILPYVIWITLLAFILDRLLLVISRRAFPWFHLNGESL